MIDYKKLNKALSKFLSRISKEDIEAWIEKDKERMKKERNKRKQ